MKQAPKLFFASSILVTDWGVFLAMFERMRESELFVFIRVHSWFSSFCRVKYHGASWNSVIRALPLALDFNTTLRCSMAKSRIAARQRAVTIFAQDQQPNGRLLVGGCVGHFICKAAGEAVHRASR